MVAIAARTLLLTQGYEPVRVISWQRAISLLTVGKVEVLEEYDGVVRSSTVALRIPSVVRLHRGFRRFRKPTRFSRVNIYARDDYACQYCGAHKRAVELTFDHVVPRSQGGKTTWTNIVTACQRCNLDKGARTPAQAGMVLRRPPFQPRDVPAVTVEVSARSVPDAWRDYLYWTGELEQDPS
jgi:5-methylcytosine-specific restriction endonuclease McrA